MRPSTLLAFGLLLGSAGCSGSGGPEPESGADAPRRMDPEILDRRRAASAPGIPERIASTADGAVVGEVPSEVLARLKADLDTRTGDAQATLVRAQMVVWPSGALGCPVPGRSYTQALVPGYHVVYEVAERRYDYRATDRGAFMLCERAMPPAS